MADETTRGRRAARKVALTYATALWAALLLAGLEGALVTFADDEWFSAAFDYLRFSGFIAGVYVLLGLALATLEIPFVLLLDAARGPEAQAQRAARGYAAALALCLALAPLEPLASLVRQSFARTSFAGLALALAGVGLALVAFLAFLVLARLLARVLRRAVRGGAVGRAVASSAAGLFLALGVVAVWGAILGGEVLEPGTRESLGIAGSAIAMLALQGGLAWLVAGARRPERVRGAALAGALAGLLALASLGDAIWRAPHGDAAVDAVSQRTLLGGYVVPPLRELVAGVDPGPVILPVAKTRPAGRRLATPTGRPPAEPVKTAEPVKSAEPVKTAEPALAPRSVPLMPGSRSMVLVTFDAFDPGATASPDAAALQEIAARSHQWPIRTGTDAATSLRELFGEGASSLWALAGERGYERHGLIAWNAKGRARLAAWGLTGVRIASGSSERNAADEAIVRARAILRAAAERPVLLWLHLPGPWGRSAVARQAALKRVGIRMRWILTELRRAGLEERSMLAVVGLPPHGDTPGVTLIAEPGGAGSRGDALSPAALGEKIRRWLRGGA
jgi:hypothetical protein